MTSFLKVEIYMTYETVFENSNRLLSFEWYLLMTTTDNNSTLDFELSSIKNLLDRNISTLIVGEDKASIFLSIDGNFDLIRGLEFINQERRAKGLEIISY